MTKITFTAAFADRGAITSHSCGGVLKLDLPETERPALLHLMAMDPITVLKVTVEQVLAKPLVDDDDYED